MVKSYFTTKLFCVSVISLFFLIQILHLEFSTNSQGKNEISKDANKETKLVNTDTFLVDKSLLKSDNNIHPAHRQEKEIHIGNVASETSNYQKRSSVLDTSTQTKPQTNVTKYFDGFHNKMLKSDMPWHDFVKLQCNERFEPQSPKEKLKVLSNKHFSMCPVSMVEKLSSPLLSDKELDWCRWALSSTGAKVIPGKSWGSLKGKDREKFDNINCNSVKDGNNPSCEDGWGDSHIEKWSKSKSNDLKCGETKTSDISCFRNDKFETYCIIRNAQINFAKMRKISRGPSMTASKSFAGNFLSADCKDNSQSEAAFPFPHLFSSQLSSQKCDIVYNGTLLMYSHDDIRNLGHTLNDILNVWVMLWLQGLARYSQQVDMLNIDSFKLGHNFDDKPNAFFTTYNKAFHKIFKGVDFSDKTLCVKNLMVQPNPQKFFIWDSWSVDSPCSLLGPASLYQRWNFHVRSSYGLLDIDRSKEKSKVLLIIRNENNNMWGNQRTSRNFLNQKELENGIKSFVGKNFNENFEFLAVDLGKLSFADQLALIASSSVMIGMHGAGIASALHMSVGEKNCCGVLEIFPRGEFFHIRGHGNMLRKVGVHYDRLDLSQQESHSDGGDVPLNSLLSKLKNLMDTIVEKPSCVLPNVLGDPYLEQGFKI